MARPEHGVTPARLIGHVALDDDATFYRTCQNLCVGDPMAQQPPDLGGDRDAGRVGPEQYFNCTREGLVLTCSEFGVCAL